MDPAVSTAMGLAGFAVRYEGDQGKSEDLVPNAPRFGGTPAGGAVGYDE